MRSGKEKLATHHHHPSPSMAAPLRHAEKSRGFTHPFANEVAEAAISAFHSRCGGLQCGEQTVVAAILVLRNGSRGTTTGPTPPPHLSVAALAVGTKFARQDVIAQDEHGVVVRDCHAEVLCVASLVGSGACVPGPFLPRHPHTPG